MRAPSSHTKRDADGAIENSLSAGVDDGDFAVIRHGENSPAQSRTENGKRQWLLVKIEGDHAEARRHPVNIAPDSVLTGAVPSTILRATRNDD